MNIKTQKKLFESFLALGVKELLLMRPSDNLGWFKELLPETKNIINDTHLYFICKKPRLRFIDTSLSYDKKKLHLGFEVTTHQHKKEVFGVIDDYNQFFPEATEFVRHKERSSQLVVRYSPDSSLTIPIEHIFNLFDATNDFSTLLDQEVVNYEVLYIGQSLGKNTPSNSYKRILKHETLQQILSDTLENEPYNEIVILLATVDNAPRLFGITDSKFECQPVLDHTIKSVENFVAPIQLSKKEIVNIMEACLIKYFYPPYNKIFKKPITSGTEKAFKKCRQYDINSTSVGLNTGGLNFMLYSSQREAKYEHNAKFQLHLDNNRINLEDILTYAPPKSD